MVRVVRVVRGFAAAACGVLRLLPPRVDARSAIPVRGVCSSGDNEGGENDFMTVFDTRAYVVNWHGQHTNQGLCDRLIVNVIHHIRCYVYCGD